jgi:ABC-type polysaccharide/polyol phosphate transport system ATPase subunit
MREEAKTVVFVSHDLAAVSRFCDRALLLEQGVVSALGPADDVIHEYSARARVSAV